MPNAFRPILSRPEVAKHPHFPFLFRKSNWNREAHFFSVFPFLSFFYSSLLELSHSSLEFHSNLKSSYPILACFRVLDQSGTLLQLAAAT